MRAHAHTQEGRRGVEEASSTMGVRPAGDASDLVTGAAGRGKKIPRKKPKRQRKHPAQFPQDQNPPRLPVTHRRL